MPALQQAGRIPVLLFRRTGVYTITPGSSSPQTQTKALEWNERVGKADAGSIESGKPMRSQMSSQNN